MQNLKYKIEDLWDNFMYSLETTKGKILFGGFTVLFILGIAFLFYRMTRPQEEMPTPQEQTIVNPEAIPDNDYLTSDGRGIIQTGYDIDTGYAPDVPVNVVEFQNSQGQVIDGLYVAGDVQYEMDYRLMDENGLSGMQAFSNPELRQQYTGIQSEASAVYVYKGYIYDIHFRDTQDLIDQVMSIYTGGGYHSTE